jgi:hypothetical protein
VTVRDTISSVSFPQVFYRYPQIVPTARRTYTTPSSLAPVSQALAGRGLHWPFAHALNHSVTTRPTRLHLAPQSARVRTPPYCPPRMLTPLLSQTASSGELPQPGDGAASAQYWRLPCLIITASMLSPCHARLRSPPTPEGPCPSHAPTVLRASYSFHHGRVVQNFHRTR